MGKKFLKQAIAKDRAEAERERFAAHGPKVPLTKVEKERRAAAVGQK